MSDAALLPEGDDPGVWIGWTTRQQALASDPERSAWVSANAGSGKTHVLTQRVIRLLLSGARPSAILCLTYTKAAASEMSNRVFQRLADWATLADEELAKRIEVIEGMAPDLFKLAEARRLFARALETPGGLKIQTIHAFCEALLHQFPLEANVAGHFSVLDDRAAALELERRAAAALPDVDVMVRSFARGELPGLFVSDPAVLRALDRGRARSAGGALWGGVLDRAAAVVGGAPADGAPAARLCLNWTNALVRRLGSAPDGRVFDLGIHLLYVQSLLAGHHPLGAADRALMTTSLSELLGRALHADDPAASASPEGES